MASETFDFINDQTLRVTTDLKGASNWSHTLTKLFNFEAQQVTTIYAEWIVSSGAGMTSQMTVQNFTDIQSQKEIERMRNKLIELNGHPDPLDGPALPKKSLAQPTP